MCDCALCFVAGEVSRVYVQNAIEIYLTYHISFVLVGLVALLLCRTSMLCAVYTLNIRMLLNGKENSYSNSSFSPLNLKGYHYYYDIQ